MHLICERVPRFRARITLTSKGETTMRHKIRFTLSALMWAMVLLAAYAVPAHAETGADNNQHALKKSGPVQTAGATLPVTGSGTNGQISKWTGSNTRGASGMTGEKVRRLRHG